MGLSAEQRATFDNPQSVFEHHTLDPMTQIEHDAMRASADFAHALHAVITQDERTSESGAIDDDWHEACVHLHALQDMIMRNCAARCYPQLYRPLGRSVQA